MPMTFEHLRIRLLFKQTSFSQLMGLVNAILFAYVVFPIGNQTLLTVWLGAFSLLLFARLALNRSFLSQRNQPRPFDFKFYERSMIAGCAVTGCFWGVASLFLLPAGQLEYEVFLAFILAGITAGASITYCTSKAAAFAFLYPTLVPYGIRLFYEGERMRMAMAILILCYLITMTVLLRMMNKHVVEAIRLRFEKEKILEELVQTQTKVVQSAKMAALGEMAGGIAHEINNPLAVIQLASDQMRVLFQKNVPIDPERVEKILGRLEKTVSRVSKIVNGLKDFAREGSSDPFEDVEISLLVDETLEFCRVKFNNRGVTLDVGNIDKNLRVWGRSVQLSQVLLNLLSNAFDALEGKNPAWVKIEAVSEGANVLISVTDSGPGVPKHVQEKIMQPFFTTKEAGKGSGLGLSISLGIIQAHRGKLSLDTKSTNTRFVVRLPKASQGSSRLTG